MQSPFRSYPRCADPSRDTWPSLFAALNPTLDAPRPLAANPAGPQSASMATHMEVDPAGLGAGPMHEVLTDTNCLSIIFSLLEDPAALATVGQGMAYDAATGQLVLASVEPEAGDIPGRLRCTMLTTEPESVQTGSPHATAGTGGTMEFTATPLCHSFLVTAECGTPYPMSANAGLVAFASRDCVSLQVWDLKNKCMVESVEDAHPSPLWDLKSKCMVESVEDAHPSPITAILLHGWLCVSVSAAYDVKLWSLNREGGSSMNCISTLQLFTMEWRRADAIARRFSITNYAPLAGSSGAPSRPPSSTKILAVLQLGAQPTVEILRIDPEGPGSGAAPQMLASGLSFCVKPRHFKDDPLCKEPHPHVYPHCADDGLGSEDWDVPQRGVTCNAHRGCPQQQLVGTPNVSDDAVLCLVKQPCVLQWPMYPVPIYPHVSPAMYSLLGPQPSDPAL
eukprot:gene5030-34817_t